MPFLLDPNLMQLLSLIPRFFPRLCQEGNNVSLCAVFSDSDFHLEIGLGLNYVRCHDSFLLRWDGSHSHSVGTHSQRVDIHSLMAVVDTHRVADSHSRRTSVGNHRPEVLADSNMDWDVLEVCHRHAHNMLDRTLNHWAAVGHRARISVNETWNAAENVEGKPDLAFRAEVFWWTPLFSFSSVRRLGKPAMTCNDRKRCRFNQL